MRPGRTLDFTTTAAMTAMVGLLLLSTGCTGGTITDWLCTLTGADLDGDGWTCDVDCDESRADRYPGAEEVCNGLDEDCDGSTWADAEGDLDLDGAIECLGEDCDDSDPTVYAGAPEVADDGIDQDCDGVDSTVCYSDGDGDGWGVTWTLVPAGTCTSPGGGDCDDGDVSVFPGAPELCDGLDNDCLSSTSAPGEVDVDSDGVLACAGDCDDDDFDVFPGAPEACNGLDDDCNPLTWSPNGAEVDADGDGVMVCADDCDDAVASIHAGAPEVPDDGVDQDCDGVDATLCFEDSDGDGYGSTANQVLSLDADCADPGEAPAPDDCDDGAAATYPGAPEVPNDGIDQDCSGTDAIQCFVDCDNDGVGDALGSVALLGVCESSAESSIGGDCDDADPDNTPGNPELCDGLDNDCDGAPELFVDSDGDTVAGCEDCDDGDALNFPGNTEACDGYDNDCDGVSESDVDEDGDGQNVCDGDCDDGDPTIGLGLPELCNLVDDDCDGSVDEDWLDLDNDGAMDCYDCDDSDPNTRPAFVDDGAFDYLEGVSWRLDTDCDGPNCSAAWENGVYYAACANHGSGFSWYLYQPTSFELAGQPVIEGLARPRSLCESDALAARFPASPYWPGGYNGVWLGIRWDSILDVVEQWDHNGPMSDPPAFLHPSLPEPSGPVDLCVKMEFNNGAWSWVDCTTGAHKSYIYRN